jgi:DUF4097 and DUF4098 domain-containing protein YvlB
MTRLISAGTISAVALFLTGCGSGPGGVSINFSGSKQASEERNLTAPHVAGSGVEVTTDLGSVEIAADPSLKEVTITAKVMASGNTDEEAKQHLDDVRVDVNRREDGVLTIAAVPKKDGTPIQAGCSFIVRMPDANGTKARTGNGSIVFTGLGGNADAHSGMGSITVAAAKGSVVAGTGNGSVIVRSAAGNVTADTSMGAVTVENATGAVKAKSGNGSVNLKNTGGVDAHTSMGAITVRDAAGDVAATSGNGSVVIAGVKGSLKAHTSMGQITIENIGGKVDAQSGNGSVEYAAAAGSGPFHLKSSMGSLKVKLPAGVPGSVKAETSLGSVTVDGPRKPKSTTGDRGSKTVVLTDDGPASTIRSGNGSITITLE